MEIIFQGIHDSEDASQSLSSVLRVLNERYHIKWFHEIHLSVTLVDEFGEDVELVDNVTGEVFRKFEVASEHLSHASVKKPGKLALVIDNTKKEENQHGD